MSGSGSGAGEGQRQPRLRRNSQQWEFDRVVGETGRVFHFQKAGRGPLPPSVKMHAMISKHVGKRAQRLERLARAELAAQHAVTAVELFFEAASAYANAQHAVLVMNDEKRFLHDGALRCFEELRRLAPTRIERIEVPFDGNVVSGYLHHAAVDGPAPLIFMIPGCDMTKEMVPHPYYNFAAQRGMHLFVFDGPGQGESNLRGVGLTVDNYERAATAALTELLRLPAVDAEAVGVYALSFGSYWGARFAATDSRIRAAALVWASICDKYYLFEEESPRYKQLFALLTRSRSEEELDEFIDRMGLEELLPNIRCPTLFTVGQYDPRSPLDEVYPLVDMVPAPTELWVFADQHHNANLLGSYSSSWYADHHSTAADWLSERLAGKPVRSPGTTYFLEANGVSPYDPEVATKRRWFDR